MGGQEEVPMDQEPGAVAGDSGHRGRLAGKNGSFHPLRLAHTFAEAQGLAQDPHFSSTSSVLLGVSAKALDLLPGAKLLLLQIWNAQKLHSLPPDAERTEGEREGERRVRGKFVEE